MIVTLAAVVLALQTPSDTTVRVSGFVQIDSVAWLLLPDPLVRQAAPLRALTLPGDSKRWARYRDRYVQAEGRVVGRTLENAKLREATPPGMVERWIDFSRNQRAAVALTVVPRRIAWRDAAGRPTGVLPVAYYTLINHGETHLSFQFTSPDIFCIRVTREGAAGAHWSDAWRPREAAHPFLRVQMGAVVRYIVTLPEAAASSNGVYTATVSLCGVTDYEVVTTFVVDNR